MVKPGDNKLAAQDRLDIHEMMAHYAWALDTADMELFLSLFAPDGAWQTVSGERGEGREGIRKRVSYFLDRPTHAGTQHTITQIVLAGEGDRATSRSYFSMLRWEGRTGMRGVTSLGWYEDKLVKLGGKWLFEERIIRPWFGAHLPWKGQPGGVPYA